VKIFRSQGAFSERPFYTDEDIERIAEQELRSVGLYPSSPAPVRIERFVEKRFGITPEYDSLPTSVLGYTRFDRTGVESIVVARELADERTRVAERRITTTLGHEAGHGLLHTHLFVLDCFNPSLFGEDQDAQPGKVLCRDDAVDGRVKKNRGYDGRWWEFQANMLMGALLLPRKLVGEAIAPRLVQQGSLGVAALPDAFRETASRMLSETFDVNPVVGRIRLDQLYPVQDAGQLTL
jgi:hypothetical protein